MKWCGQFDFPTILEFPDGRYPDLSEFLNLHADLDSREILGFRPHTS